MYLHNDDAKFLMTIQKVSEFLNIWPEIVEKDYYVTLILKELAAASDKIVFKGGTSLSKARKAINRFSEDVDISFTEHIGASRRKKLKHQIIAPIAQKLGLTISNFDNAQSDRDLNNYDFVYTPLFKSAPHIIPTVKVETSLITAVFPYDEILIGNYIADYSKDVSLSEYALEPFLMKVQALERTMVDKIFAICDYYMQGKSRRLSRHIYDIHMLFPKISFDNKFIELVKQVREIRNNLEICPSAKPEININALLKEICKSDFFKSDYEGITRFFIFDNVKYKEAKATLLKVVETGAFN